MSAPRVAMRKIKECLRLKLECGLSLERVAKAMGLSKGVVAKYVTRAGALGLDWPALAALDESVIAARLCAPQVRVRGQRALIDLATMHFELRRKGMTLLLLWQEYQQANANLPTYQYTQFCQYYHDYAATLRRSMRQVHRAGEKLFIDYAGRCRWWIPIPARCAGRRSPWRCSARRTTPMPAPPIPRRRSTGCAAYRRPSRTSAA